MCEGDLRRCPENLTSTTLRPPTLTEEMRATLDPRLMLRNFVTSPTCGPREILRDLPTIGMTLAGSWGLLQGIVFLHERLNIQNPEGIRSVESLAWLVSTLAIMGAAHFINRRLPSPFGH